MYRLKFFKSLDIIIDEKQYELQKMCRFNQENTIGYCIVSDELEDAEKIVASKHLSDAELISLVKEINAKTTCSYIMGACERFINRMEGQWGV